MTKSTACKLLACLLMMYSLFVPTVFAEEGEQEAPVLTAPELMQIMAQVKKSNATFIERKHFSMLKEPLLFAGTLTYTAPDRLEKNTNVPKAESMVLIKDKLEIRSGDADKARIVSLQEFPAIWAFVESIRSTLAGDLETLSRFYKVAIEGHANKWKLILLPLDSKMKKMVSEIRITGSQQHINTIEVMEVSGDHAMMEITKDDS